MKQRAFTLIELLVAIAIVGVLMALTLPALAKAKEKGRQTLCASNLRQLSVGFSLYHADSHDQFPAPGSVMMYGPQPEDWIWWQYGRGVTNSAIAPFVAGFRPGIFTCPSDKTASLMQTQGLLPGNPYRYSYSLTSYDLRGNFNPGMATVITQTRKIFPFRITSVINPSGKVMLVEESRDTIDDPRWVPDQNYITDRHNRKGNVVFADSHIDAVLPQFGTNQVNTLPTQ